MGDPPSGEDQSREWSLPTPIHGGTSPGSGFDGGAVCASAPGSGCGLDSLPYRHPSVTPHVAAIAPGAVTHSRLSHSSPERHAAPSALRRWQVCVAALQ